MSRSGARVSSSSAWGKTARPLKLDVEANCERQSSEPRYGQEEEWRGVTGGRER